MAEQITTLRDKKSVRWLALILASLSIFGAYYFNYALSSIKPVLETMLGWNSSYFGTYTSAYSWFNVFLFMLVISGMILDKLGVRKTGLGATIIMFIGTAINYWAVTHNFPDNSIIKLPLIGEITPQVLYSSLGFALFGVGTEAIGITISKAVVRWFKGKELALAMGMQMAIARLGTLLALAVSLPLALNTRYSAPIIFALILMLLGILSFLVFSFYDRKLDKSVEKALAFAKEKNIKLELLTDSSDDDFKIKDILLIIKNKGFWYIALLCVLFYSAVFPFLFYANDLMINKYHVAPKLAGLIPSLLPLGTIILTPVFGSLYDTKGKGATIMILGSLILILVHGVLVLPFIKIWWVAAAMVIILGIGFSLVPSAMWPSVPKIIPEKQLGTAYAVIFWIQNIGLMLVPLLIGKVLDNTNPMVIPDKEAVKTAIFNVVDSNANYFENLTPKEFALLKEKIASEAINAAIIDDYEEKKLTDTTEIKQFSEKVEQGLTDTLQNNFYYVFFRLVEPDEMMKIIDVSVKQAYYTTKNDTANLISANSLTNVIRKNIIDSINTIVKLKIKNGEISNEEVKNSIINTIKIIASKYIQQHKVNVRYDYFYALLIFVTLSVLSLLFGFLLKHEDKIKGYGLELPNKKPEAKTDYKEKLVKTAKFLRDEMKISKEKIFELTGLEEYEYEN